MASLPGAAINRAASGVARTAANVLLRNQSAYATKKLGFSSNMIGKNIRTQDIKSAKYIIGSSKPPLEKSLEHILAINIQVCPNRYCIYIMTAHSD